LLENYRPHITSQLGFLNDGRVIDDLGLVMQGWKSELLADYDRDVRRYVQSVSAEIRNIMIVSYHNELLILFTGQLKNLRLSLLVAFDEALADTITNDDVEFAAITSRKKGGYEDDFTRVARNTAIDDTNWDWVPEFRALQSGLAEKIKICEKGREVPPTPIQAKKTEWITSTKFIETNATLYRDGKLMVEVDTDNKTFDYALRGRVVILVLDKEGFTIGETNKFHCTLRGGLNPFGSPRCGRDTFLQQFPQDVGMRAVCLNIFQTDAPETVRALPSWLF